MSGTGLPAVRGQPLSLRLAGVLALGVVVVLLLVGVVVNRMLSGSLEDELTGAQRERLTLAAAAIGELDPDRPRERVAIQALLGRIAIPVHGRVELVDGSGAVVLSAGRLPAGAATDEIAEPVPGGDARLVVRVPRAEAGVLRVFNFTLLAAGLLVVIALLVIAALVSERLTRPLRGVAAAARRLEAGELNARATGGPDRESAELAGAFNAMAARVERSEMLRRRAASDMAHDLATPATLLESQLQAMVDGVVPADREQLERARAAAGTLSGVIVQLRDLVDAESAHVSRRPEQLEVGRLIDDARQALEPLFAEHGVRLDADGTDHEATVEVDPAQVGRALRNVLTNAAQHAPAGSAVSVSTERAPRAVVIRVRDAGPGIAAEDLPHVFERFYRADPSRPGGSARSGSGIGLTIARELLTAQGGSIAVEASGPHGTTFRITLPETLSAPPTEGAPAG